MTTKQNCIFDKIITANKEYKCDKTGGRILPGERYYKRKTVVGDKLVTYRSKLDADGKPV